MLIVTLLVLPLPYKIRRSIVKFWIALWHKTEFRVTIYVCSVLVGILFVDAAQRSIKYPVQRRGGDEQSQVNPPEGSNNHLHHGYNELSSSEYLVKKFYNQRNFYLTGIVLFLELSIPTIINILKRIIKWNDQLAEKKGGKSLDVDVLKKQLSTKESDVATLKKQIEGLQKAYNEKADLKAPREEVTTEIKKDA